MTAQDILQDARDSLLYCMELVERLGMYRSIAENAAKKGYDDAAIDLADKCRQLKEEFSIMRKRADKADALIGTLKNANHQTILRLIYLDGYRIRDASEKMHYTERWTHKLHKEALSELERRCA